MGVSHDKVPIILALTRVLHEQESKEKENNNLFVVNCKSGLYKTFFLPRLIDRRMQLLDMLGSLESLMAKCLWTKSTLKIPGHLVSQTLDNGHQWNYCSV
jgi:hypothetical protein